MSTYYGDFPTSHTSVCMVFDSFAASTGAPSATSNFAAGDIVIFKDGGTTQRSSSAGITVSTSFDTNTGLQMVVIDLSDNTDAGFYAAGHEYSVAVADVTIDGQTIRFWLGSFSIERAGGVLALAKSATSGFAALKALIDAVDDFVDTEVAAIKTVTDKFVFTVANEVNANTRYVGGTSQTAGDLAAMITAVDDYVDTEVAAIKAKTDNLPSAVKKNVALANFMFKMVDSADHITPKTGLTVACKRSIDGAAFADCNTATATEIASGWYKVSLAASDLNGTTIALKFTSAGADQRDLLIVTQT